MSSRQAIAKLCMRLQQFSPLLSKACNFPPNSGKFKTFYENEFGGYSWSRHHRETFRWVFLSGQAAILVAINSVPCLAEDISLESSSKNDPSGADMTDLTKVEDGSVISNEHTSKWRVFTDNGRDFFRQGNLEQSEKFFISAIQEAREGFGERDPHVASSCNNLAELYRVQKAFDKAEPLYMEAIDILENYYGKDDVRVGAAFHNLGQFYLVQRELEKARVCYERALKIKRRVLGEAHMDYADTMYHLGTVLYLQGKEKDSEDLVLDSIRILEESGQGESIVCIRRLQYLAQMYTKSSRFADAETSLRKILHIMELSKGWKSLGTILSAERLALALQSLGRLNEAEELLERCLDARKNLLPKEHLQNAANMLYIARVKMLIFDDLMKKNSSHATSELNSAKTLLGSSIRICRQILVQLVDQKGNKKQKITGNDGHSAVMILLQSLNALGSLEATKLKFHESREYIPSEANAALLQCILTFKEFGSKKLLFDSPEVKAEYLSFLHTLYDLISKCTTSEMQLIKDVTDEIKHVEDEISRSRRQ